MVSMALAAACDPFAALAAVREGCGGASSGVHEPFTVQPGPPVQTIFLPEQWCAHVFSCSMAHLY